MYFGIWGAEFRLSATVMTAGLKAASGIATLVDLVPKFRALGFGLQNQNARATALLGTQQ